MTTTAIKADTQWHIDAAHSEIGFKVKHLMISHVKGVFTDYSATIQARGNDFLHANLTLRINPASISTGDAGRDQHLRGADFFDTEQFGEILFVSKSYEKTDPETFTIHGDLTIKGVTHPVQLQVEIGGIAKDPWGNQKAGLSVTGKINRKDWGLTWNAALETGGVLVGEEIRIHADIQLIRQA